MVCEGGEAALKIAQDDTRMSATAPSATSSLLVAHLVGMLGCRVGMQGRNWRCGVTLPLVGAAEVDAAPARRSRTRVRISLCSLAAMDARCWAAERRAVNRWV